MENGKAYATSSKVAGKYIAGLEQGFNKVGTQFRALSWKIHHDVHGIVRCVLLDDVICNIT